MQARTDGIPKLKNFQRYRKRIFAEVKAEFRQSQQKIVHQPGHPRLENCLVGSLTFVKENIVTLVKAP